MIINERVMSKVAHYLQEHLLGEVTDSPEVRRHFAHDASILQMMPAAVIYPRNESDVRKTARFAWQLAERGRVLPITARGGGSDTSGAAIGSGVILVFMAHMNRILALDPKKQFVVVEPGATYDKLEQTLYTHGLFLPPYPASKYYATVGGGLANNSIGEKSVKYGALGEYVEQLRVVLANGEIIETKPLSKRELNKKLGLSTLEGNIYRSIDTLLEDNADLLKRIKSERQVWFNSTAYNLADIKTKKGFNLTPIFIGSQGTLGIVTEATFEVIPYNPVTRMALVSLEKLRDLDELLPKFLELKPSILDMINREAIAQITRINSSQLAGVIGNPRAAIHLIIEFDDPKDGAQKKEMKKLKKMVEKVEGFWQTAETPEDQDKIWKIRQSVSTLLNHVQGQTKAIPLGEDLSIPVGRLSEFLEKIAQIYRAAELKPIAWGHAGIGVVRMYPMLDLGQIGDRQKLFRLADAVYSMTIKMGGSISAGSGEGRVRAPYAKFEYGDEMHKLMLEVKKIFDPYGLLNPGVKTASNEQVKSMLRGSYNLDHRHEHLPRS